MPTYLLGSLCPDLLMSDDTRHRKQRLLSIWKVDCGLLLVDHRVLTVRNLPDVGDLSQEPLLYFHVCSPNWPMALINIGRKSSTFGATTYLMSV